MTESLFHQTAYQPLASRMRPRNLDEFVGQEHVLGEGKPLRDAILKGHLHSMILWGPPGVGKTTLARMVAHYGDAHFETLSAVLAGVKDIREAIGRAAKFREAEGRKTILFVDEIHRFNKSQQDAFLPFVENGTVILMGATTDNPSFELNNALLSRCRVYIFRSLDTAAILRLLQNALTDRERGIATALKFEKNVLEKLAEAADGDARRALNLLEIASDLAENNRVDSDVLDEILVSDARRFDNKGEDFYNQISALHKSVRGSSPDAALYWLARMLDGGCDPVYIARRIVRMASEDIGNADPRGITLALNAWDVQERLGSPEGALALAQAVAYLAVAPKSNAVYSAFNKVMADIRRQPSYEVPIHIRNAPTKLMKELDYGKDYRYAHDEPDAFAAGENYFPEEIASSRYYYPSDQGLEKTIGEKLARFRQLNEKSVSRRYGNGETAKGKQT